MLRRSAHGPSPLISGGRPSGRTFSSGSVSKMLNSFWQQLFGRQRKGRPAPAGSPAKTLRFRPGVEGLENRLVPSAVSGHVWLDATGNGLSADDAAHSGVTVKLYKDSNGSGALDSN